MSQITNHKHYKSSISSSTKLKMLIDFTNAISRSNVRSRSSKPTSIVLIMQNRGLSVACALVLLLKFYYYYFCSDNRLRPGDELLMVNGKSLVGLTHNEAVDVLKSTQKLVQLVVATESTEGDSVASSLQSIPEAILTRAYQSPPLRSFSPLSIESSSSSATVNPHAVAAIGPELQQVPQRNAFLREKKGSAQLELQLKVDPSLHHGQPGEGGEAETRFSTVEDRKEMATSPMESSDQFEVVHTVTSWARTTPNHKTMPPPNRPEIDTIIYVKTEGKSLGFSICGGKGSRQGDLGILVRNIDPEGLAAQDGRLRRGDEILDVNGKSLKDCTHKKAAGIIRVREKTKIQNYCISHGISRLS